jgi:hypothetical protein
MRVLLNLTKPIIDRTGGPRARPFSPNVLVCVLVVCLSACAAACGATGEDVLSGPTDQKMFDAVQQRIAAGEKLIKINSRGGREEDALRIAQLLRRNRVALEVEGACLSSCAQYLLVGASRVIVHPGAAVAFHGNSYGIMHLEGLDEKSVANISIVRGNARAAERLYNEQSVSTSLLSDATRTISPVCVQYEQGRAKLYGRIDFWIPTRSYLTDAGIRVEGWWPSSQRDLEGLTSSRFAQGTRVYLGPQLPAKSPSTGIVETCPSEAGIHQRAGEHE